VEQIILEEQDTEKQGETAEQITMRLEKRGNQESLSSFFKGQTGAYSMNSHDFEKYLWSKNLLR
jgi:hypothetical protein